MQDVAAQEEDNKNYGDVRLQGSEQSILAMGIVGLGKETMAENSSHHRECSDMVVMQVYRYLPTKPGAEVQLQAQLDSLLWLF